MLKKRILSIFFLAGLLLSASGGFLSAQDRPLELDYPTIPGVTIVPKNVEETSLPEYIDYIFNLALWVVGLIAFGALVYGGFRYITSMGNPASMGDAKSQIFAGILGLIILVSSYLVLTTINPQLVVFDVEEIQNVSTVGPGVWLCNASIDNIESFMENPNNFESEERERLTQLVQNHCFRPSTKTLIPDRIKNGLEKAYVVGDYGAVLHEGPEPFKGECQVVAQSQSVGTANSVTPFLINETAFAGNGVTLYENRDFNLDEPGKEANYTSDASSGMEPCQSIKINEENQWVAVAFKDRGFQGECEVFDRSDRDLNDDYVGRFCIPGLAFWERQTCIYSLKVFKGLLLD